jgi:hypothetical protein
MIGLKHENICRHYRFQIPQIKNDKTEESCDIIQLFTSELW